MVKVTLKSTTNTEMKRFEGLEGTLSVEHDGRFHFYFKGSDGGTFDLTSGIVNQLGDLEHPRSKEVSFQTKNSVYVFEKREKVLEGLFDYCHEGSLDNQMLEASNSLQEQKAQKEAFGRAYGSALRQNQGSEKGR